MLLLKRCYKKENVNFTISIFVWFSVTGGVIFYNRSVDAVAELFVHIHSDLIGDPDEEVDKEPTLPDEKTNYLELFQNRVVLHDPTGKFTCCFCSQDMTNERSTCHFHLSEISSNMSMSLAARPSRLNSGATDRAVT